MEQERVSPGNGPRISICIPTYNRSDLLRKTLISVMRQTVKPYEIIVADNCSVDDTARVAKSFPQVMYYCNEHNLGLAGNSNKCIQLAKGDFVTILHSDDLIAPNWHEYWLSALSRYKDSDVAVFFSSIFTIDSDERAKVVYRVTSKERVLPAGESFKFLWSRNMCGLPASGSIIFRKSIFSDIGGYVEELTTEADALLVLRILNRYAIFHSPRLLYAFRIHPFQTFDRDKETKTQDKKFNVLARHLKIVKDFYEQELRPEYRQPMFYKKVAHMYLTIAFFNLLIFKKELAAKYCRLTIDAVPDALGCITDYFALLSVIFHYIKKLIWGRILALPIKNTARAWVKD
ncbi:MAG: glycosyltransferase family A protein [Candidatus Omnitrophota bacterium]